MNGIESCREFLAEEVIPDYLAKNRKLKKHLAADMDMTPSQFARKCAQLPSDTARLTLDDFEKWLSASGDLRAVFYLLEKYSGGEQDELDRLRARVAELEGRNVKVIG